MNIKATIHDDGVKELFKSLHKQAPIAIAVALTRTGQKIKDNVNTEMNRVFDRPTPYTMRSLQLLPATKQRLEAVIWFKGTGLGYSFGTSHYLEPQVWGGDRPQKKYELQLKRTGFIYHGGRTVPGQAARINKYGNMSPGQIVQVLTALRALRGTPTIGGVNVKYKLRKGTKDYFAVKRDSHLAPGVWERTKAGVKPIIMFVSHARYKKRLPFFEVTQKTYDKHYRDEFNKAFNQAVATAHYKGKW